MDQPALASQHYKLILRTFLSVFPEASLWGDGSLVVGSRRPLRLTADSFARRLAEPGVREALAPLGRPTFETLMALRIADGPALRAFVGDGPLLTDDRPLVEYYLSLPRDNRAVDLSGLLGPTDRTVGAGPVWRVPRRRISSPAVMWAGVTSRNGGLRTWISA